MAKQKAHLVVIMMSGIEHEIKVGQRKADILLGQEWHNGFIKVKEASGQLLFLCGNRIESVSVIVPGSVIFYE